MNNTKFSTDNQPQTTTRTRRTIDQEIEDLEKKLALNSPWCKQLISRLSGIEA